jgi:hypothetical protein
MLQYAADDVRYLLPLVHRLRRDLAAADVAALLTKVHISSDQILRNSHHLLRDEAHAGPGTDDTGSGGTYQRAAGARAQGAGAGSGGGRGAGKV